MNTQLVLFPAALLAIALSTPARAELIADWNLAGMAGTETSLEASSAAAGVTGNALPKAPP